jgi:hypothetical protein
LKATEEIIMKNLSFSEALVALRSGYRVARVDWIMKNVWIMIVPGSDITIDPLRPLGKALPDKIGERINYLSHIDMHTEKGEIVPWTVTQEDLLALDWRVLNSPVDVNLKLFVCINEVNPFNLNFVWAESEKKVEEIAKSRKWSGAIKECKPPQECYKNAVSTFTLDYWIPGYSEFINAGQRASLYEVKGETGKCAYVYAKSPSEAIGKIYHGRGPEPRIDKMGYFASGCVREVSTGEDLVLIQDPSYTRRDK